MAAFIHGKNTYVSLDADDISPYTKSTAFNRSADSHDNTAYGKNSKTYNGGLLDGTVTISGTYYSGATGPAAVIEPLLGSTVVFVFRPEGIGTGKPERTVDVVVTAYNESSPVADNVQWTAELQMSDDVATTTQA